ncbi:MAG: NADPH-dependent FMN reductase, partial [Candidatus Limnocylindria bacterium]
MSELRILGISGSLREGSYNRALLRAAAGLLPDGSRLETCEIREIPPFDQDLEASGDPPAVVELKARIRESHALLVVTPEYNWGVPGVLKNAIDWASRPPDQPFDGKPIAILGASPSAAGTARA